jgi:hypothetical protein
MCLNGHRLFWARISNQGEIKMENATAPAADVSSDASNVSANAPKADAKPVVKADASPIVKVDENGVGEAPKKIWKLNINGKEVEYDASNEDKLKSDIQKVFGIEEKARTTAQKADMAEKLLQMMQDDPRGFEKQCKIAGIDFEKLAVDILWNKHRLNSLTPEQRELEEYKEKEAERKAAEEEAKKAAEVAEGQRKTQEWAQKFEKDCEAALNLNKIPKTRLSLALIAQYIDAGLTEKKEYTVEQVLPYVARDLKEIHRSTMEQLDGDDLLAYVGETLSNKIAKARVERYKRTTANPVPEKKTVNPNPQNKVDISKLKGRAYWKAMRQMKSEAGIGLHPGAPGNS